VDRDGEFVFDGGPTVITAPHYLEELFAVAGRRMADHVELLPVEPFYRLMWADGDRFDYCGDAQRMMAEIRRRNPADVDGYRRFVAYSRAVFDTAYAQLAASPGPRLRDMVAVAADLIRLRADRSIYDTVSRFVRDEHVRQALSFHALLAGANPFETSALYTMFPYLERTWGVFFPRGGTGALVHALVQLFVELGGELRLRTPVERVHVSTSSRGARHLVSAGRTAEVFDLVVSNANLHHTYGSIYRGVDGAARMRRKLERLPWSMSLFVLSIGTDRPYTSDVAHHSVLFGPRYRTLLDDIFHGTGLPRDFSLYLHAPTVTDPSLAPPGGGAFQVLAPVPHLGNAPLDWQRIAPGYADRILEVLEGVMPDLRRHVVVRRIMTPQSFKTELRTHLGSAFSCAPRLGPRAWLRRNHRDPRIPSLYLVGGGTHPGAGVPGAITAAAATARIIARDFGLEA
jgi:phytoene desaturase